MHIANFSGGNVVEAWAVSGLGSGLRTFGASVLWFGI